MAWPTSRPELASRAASSSLGEGEEMEDRKEQKQEKEKK
jgi:hypothetical protein